MPSKITLLTLVGLATAIQDSASGKQYKQILYDDPPHDWSHPTCTGSKTRIKGSNACGNDGVYIAGECKVICGGWGVVSCRACQVDLAGANMLTVTNYYPTERVSNPNVNCSYIKGLSQKNSTTTKKIELNTCLPFASPCKPTTPNCNNGSTSIIPCSGKRCYRAADQAEGAADQIQAVQTPVFAISIS
jgi:hypothetical protein